MRKQAEISLFESCRHFTARFSPKNVRKGHKRNPPTFSGTPQRQFHSNFSMTHGSNSQYKIIHKCFVTKLQQEKINESSS